jgi:hypothetical protein
MEAQLRDTQVTMFDWINIRQVEEYYQKLDGPLPPIPPQAETGGRNYAIKVGSILPIDHQTQS